MTKLVWIGGLLIVLSLLAIHMIMKNNSIPNGLGVRSNQLAPLPASPNAVSSQTAETSRKVAPLPYLQNRAASRQRLLQVIQADLRTQILTEEPDYIHVVYTVPVIPFKDDVEFLLDDLEQAIHLRSASRVGWSDLGVNRKRVEAIRQQYLGTAPRTAE